MEISGSQVCRFTEKPIGEGGLINGGFFVLSPACLDLIRGDETVWEEEPLRFLAESGQLMAFAHGGFWHPMDTLRDRRFLEGLWKSGGAPWQVWDGPGTRAVREVPGLP
jgi:glucose-1-phosphate cytidylyltransferase